MHFPKKKRRICLADPKKYSIIPMRGRTVASIRALTINDAVCFVVIPITDYMRITIIQWKE